MRLIATLVAVAALDARAELPTPQPGTPAWKAMVCSFVDYCATHRTWACRQFVHDLRHEPKSFELHRHGSAVDVVWCAECMDSYIVGECREHNGTWDATDVHVVSVFPKF